MENSQVQNRLKPNESRMYLAWTVETHDVDARVGTDTHMHKTSTVTLLHMHAEG